jgi:hypothetical protein
MDWIAIDVRLATKATKVKAKNGKKDFLRASDLVFTRQTLSAFWPMTSPCEAGWRVGDRVETHETAHRGRAAAETSNIQRPTLNIE